MDSDEPPDGLVTEAIIVYTYEGFVDDEPQFGYGLIKMTNMPDHHVLGLLDKAYDMIRDQDE